MIVQHEKDKVPMYLWTNGVQLEHEAMQQVRNVASLPIVGPHVAIMPDVHWGIGATVGSVIPTRGAIIPAAVGVDIGCGMMAARMKLDPNRLSLAKLRATIEDQIPLGFDTWQSVSKRIPSRIRDAWNTTGLGEQYEALEKAHPRIRGKSESQLGTLGGGNHFIEICTETASNDHVWLMLHSGSRGPGNRIGTYFIDKAMQLWNNTPGLYQLPNKELAWFDEGTPLFHDYVQAVGWAQRFAAQNRVMMANQLMSLLHDHIGEAVQVVGTAINCHHNYVQQETHFGQNIYVTRKGAVSAKEGELGIIPGSMGARSFIVQGKGNPDAFRSCSHGAGRVMSRGRAKREITVAQHEQATAGVECRKDEKMLDESPAAYKDIDAVMAAQSDLVDIRFELKQIICVKG